MLKTLFETMPALARIAPKRYNDDSRNGCERRRPGCVCDCEVSRFRAKIGENNNNNSHRLYACIVGFRDSAN